MSLDFLRETPEFKDLVRAVSILPRVPEGQTSLFGGEERPRLSVSGLTDAAVPYLFSQLALAGPKKVVFVRPSSRSLADFEDRARFFLRHLGSSKIVRCLPSLADNPYLDSPPSLDAVASRMRFFFDLANRPPILTVTSLFGLLRPFPAPERLPGLFLRLNRNAEFDRDALIARLAAFGYVREDLIAFRGEYAFRGGIVDVFSPWQKNPVRIEFGGDRVVSLREFDPSTQRAVHQIDGTLVPSLSETPGFSPGADSSNADASVPASVPFTRYLEDAVFVFDHPEEIEKEWTEATADFRAQEPTARKARSGLPALETIYPPSLYDKLRAEAVFCGEVEIVEDRNRREFVFGFQPVPRFENKIFFFLETMKRIHEERDRCVIFLSTPPILKKIGALLETKEIPSLEAESPLVAARSGEVVLCLGDLERGFGYPREKAWFYAEKDILTEERVIPSRPAARPSISQFQDLKAGDYIVHADYGVGLFRGLVKMDVEARPAEFMELGYRDDDTLFVPVEDLSLVQKYTPVGTGVPLLDKLGTGNWQKTKERTKKAVAKLAHELLELYAQRKAVKGFAFSPEGRWQDEFEKTFEYDETEDQLRSIRDIKDDMESDAPMDRLLCGDVGYGKTEVAIRAAFKAVMDGKQAAVLCPTTVLASQHYKTFSSRMVLFPVKVAALTRFQSPAEQRRIVDDLKNGRVDIVVGTHRLLSADVAFRDLGLLVVDEEQRFGVSHKEKIKHIKATVDVLTLTATPIPRTLNLSLTGLRDISLIETPPKDRLAVHTVVTTFSPRLISGAIKQELARGGQVYYVINKIEEMDTLAAKIRGWVPEARLVTVHGQMPPAELEKRMIDFINQRYDILVSTTIIENGIDIPLVNTLLVHRADHFGLAQLYQLRGRVGRSSRQAFAYFLVPPFSELTPIARKRLEAIKEFSELGSGFRLAMKDLEIRGAGHLFGEAQHGTMEAVGYDYFIHLLEQAIKEIKGEAVQEVRCEINLRVEVRIPESYIPAMNVRLNLYKRISSAADSDEIRSLEEEIRDRFGPPPPGVDHLLQYGRIKFLAGKLSLASVDRVDHRVILKFQPSTPVDPARIAALLNRTRGSMTPQGVMTLPLRSSQAGAFLRETARALLELSGIG
ncbi:MAG: transcription-repair coupling factor [Candidatus Aminicenantes bacterium]|nr:transcription-repair coupling factor [Candidatus Aminicenantes bacterium]